MKSQSEEKRVGGWSPGTNPQKRCLSQQLPTHPVLIQSQEDEHDWATPRPAQPTLAGPRPGHVGCLQLAIHCCASPTPQSLRLSRPKRESRRTPDRQLTPFLPVCEGVPHLSYTAPQSHTSGTLGSLGHRLDSSASLRRMAVGAEGPGGIWHLWHKKHHPCRLWSTVLPALTHLFATATTSKTLCPMQALLLSFK